MSNAQQARKHVLLTSKDALKLFFETGNFVDDFGNVIRAEHVCVKQGILYVTFPDGSTTTRS